MHNLNVYVDRMSSDKMLQIMLLVRDGHDWSSRTDPK